MKEQDLKCDKCIYETMESGVSFLVRPCKLHDSPFYNNIVNAMSAVQDLKVRSQAISNKKLNEL